MKNFYDTLGVAENASEKEIKNAFKVLAKNIILTKAEMKINLKRSMKPMIL